MGTDAGDGDLRHEAEKSLKRKRDFRNFAFIYFFVNALLIAIWFLSGAGYFWPIWVLFGMAIPLVLSAWDAYGPGKRPVSDADIEREMRRLKGGD